MSALMPRALSMLATETLMSMTTAAEKSSAITSDGKNSAPASKT
jgi:hypothetical protein